MTPDITIRPLTPQDEAFLWEMLYQALYVPPDAPPVPRTLLDEPALRRYVAGWGRAGDGGVLAQVEQLPIGAAWWRLPVGAEHGYGYVDDATPELTVAVVPEWRGRGVGTRLLAALLRAARARHPAVCLSVAASNPALRLYERLGFVAVKQAGASITMCLRW